MPCQKNLNLKDLFFHANTYAMPKVINATLYDWDGTISLLIEIHGKRDKMDIPWAEYSREEQNLIGILKCSWLKNNLCQL